MIHVSASLAARIERVETSLMSAVGDAVTRRLGDPGAFDRVLGGGVAVMAGPDSPCSKVAGLGFAPLAADALEAVEQAFARASAPVRVELSSLGDPDAARLLSARGYVLSGFENVLGLTLPALPARATDVSIVVSPAGAADAAALMHVLTTGFLHADVVDGPPPTETVDPGAVGDIFSDMAQAPGFSQYLARRANQPAGGASMRIHDGIAQLCGAATLPEHRRRGVQTALLHHRLAIAAAAGCDLAVVTTAPGSKSQENVQRLGFELLYVRAILIKPV